MSSEVFEWHLKEAFFIFLLPPNANVKMPDIPLRPHSSFIPNWRELCLCGDQGCVRAQMCVCLLECVLLSPMQRLRVLTVPRRCPWRLSSQPCCLWPVRRHKHPCEQWSLLGGFALWLDKTWCEYSWANSFSAQTVYRLEKDLQCVFPCILLLLELKSRASVQHRRTWGNKVRGLIF